MVRSKYFSLLVAAAVSLGNAIVRVSEAAARAVEVAVAFVATMVREAFPFTDARVRLDLPTTITAREIGRAEAAAFTSRQAQRHTSRSRAANDASVGAGLIAA